MKPSKIFMTGGFVALLSSPAFAADTVGIKSLADKSAITISGTVESIENEREFTLRDKAGTVSVDIESTQSVVLKKGDEVTVVGIVDQDITGTDINASNVSVRKNLMDAVSDAIEVSTDVSLEGAAVVSIDKLPDEGLVKISGTVSDVDNEKEFTLQDGTGTINVDIESNETAALTKGAQVTVIGYVDNGLLGKDINAKKVLVITSAPPKSE